jgi:hypothetical protein
VAMRLHPHVEVGDAPQFAFDQRDQLVQTLGSPSWHTPTTVAYSRMRAS